jgi:hypothetical protein
MGRPEVRSDYVCLSNEYDNLDSLNHLLEKAPDVADQRPDQELLSAVSRSSGSRFVFPLPTRRRIGGLYVRVVRIEETRASVGDDIVVAALLAGIPFPPFVEPLLHKPFFERKWDYRRQCDHWVASDGTTVVALAIYGASAAAVARIRLRFDDLRLLSPGIQPSLRILHALLEEKAGAAPRAM